jgi:hypothetical protein
MITPHRATYVLLTVALATLGGWLFEAAPAAAAAANAGRVVQNVGDRRAHHGSAEHRQYSSASRGSISPRESEVLEDPDEEPTPLSVVRGLLSRAADTPGSAVGCFARRSNYLSSCPTLGPLHVVLSRFRC